MRAADPVIRGPTPAALAYAMPAEWAPHEAVWLSWPRDAVTFPGRVGAVEELYLSIIRALEPRVRVDLLVSDSEAESRVAAWARGEGVKNLRIHRIPVVDVWIRDYGPTFLRGPRGLAMVDWVFNAWGGKYESLLPDGGVPAKLQELLGVPRFTPGVVMEGGSFDVNGAGCVLTTEQCLLAPNRNPRMPREQVEAVLRDHLGCEKVLWLGSGIEGDDTDGHVDDVARFVAPDTIVACREDDPRDPDHAILEDNWKRLRGMTDAAGKPFKLIALPMPDRVDDAEGRRLPASYANFLITNGLLLVPVFGHANDARAEAVLRAVFPGRTVVPMPCEPMVHGLGTLHCASQQQPAAAGP